MMTLASLTIIADSNDGTTGVKLEGLTFSGAQEIHRAKPNEAKLR